MAIAPTISPATAEFTLTVEDAAEALNAPVYGFHIERLVNKIPYAKIVLRDGDIAQQKFEISNSDDFVPGKTVILSVGSVDEKKELFKGIIISQKITQNQRGTTLELSVKDAAVRMTVGRKNKYFYNQTDTQILEEILNEYSSKGITSSVEEAQFVVEHEEMVQYYCTDWDFLVSRAEATSRVVLVNNGEITINTPEAIQNDDNFSLVFGNNTYNFEAEMDGRNEYSEVTARSWNNIDREVEEKDVSQVQNFQTAGNISPDALAEDVIELDDFILQHTGNLKSSELELWAYSKLLRSRLSKIKGRAQVDGTSEVNIGDNINIAKFSERFDGTAYVSGVKHEMSGNSTWYTDIQFGYSQEWFYEKYQDINDQPASGLLPAVNGLSIGIVTGISDGDDPEGNYRVRVKMPLVNDESEGVWARVTTLDAGDGYGVFFRPEVGDEVILGFLNDDPRQPIVLGSVFSAGNAEPEISIASDDENFEKGIFTKSGLKVVFNDDDETILIATKDDENQLLIAAKNDASVLISDNNRNTIEMNKDGILIESGKDLTLKAQGDVKIEGTKVEVQASTELSAKGNATANFESSGSTVVKGSIVQIN